MGPPPEALGPFLVNAARYRGAPRGELYTGLSVALEGNTAAARVRPDLPFQLIAARPPPLGGRAPAARPLNARQPAPPKEPPAALTRSALTTGRVDEEITSARRSGPARARPPFPDAASVPVGAPLLTTKPAKGTTGAAALPRPLVRVLIAGAQVGKEARAASVPSFAPAAASIQGARPLPNGPATP